MSVTFEELLERDGHFIYKTRGRSMEPMLRQDRDLVVISSPSSRLKRFDVALYRHGEAYVLHRVIKAKDGCYIIRGDNTYTDETVPESAVIGVLSSFQRKGRQISTESRCYRLYVRLWLAIYPIRRAVIAVLRRAAGTAKRLRAARAAKKRLDKNEPAGGKKTEKKQQ